MSSAKRTGLFTCTDVVAGSMMGSGIALLPANLVSIGDVVIWSRIISIIGAMLLAYVYTRLATKSPRQGDPIAYAGEISPAFGFQTGVPYYHASWIGSLTTGITAISYPSTFFPVLNDPVPVDIACIVTVWVSTFVNMFSNTWISRLTVIGLVLVLTPVVVTAIVGWHWFDVAAYAVNQNITDTTDGHVIIKNILFCLWAFMGVESTAVDTGTIENSKRTVPLATISGIGLADAVYTAVTQVLSGTYPSSVMVAPGASFAISASTIPGNQVAPLVPAFTAFTYLTSLSSWMTLIGQAGVCATNDGNSPKAYGEINNNGIPKKGLLLVVVKITTPMILITLANSVDGKASDLFDELAGIAVLLTMLPYFYSCVDPIHLEGVNTHSPVSLIYPALGCVFRFVVLMDASFLRLAGTFIVSLTILMFYVRKTHERWNHLMDNHTVSNIH